MMLEGVLRHELSMFCSLQLIEQCYGTKKKVNERSEGKKRLDKQVNMRMSLSNEDAKKIVRCAS